MQLTDSSRRLARIVSSAGVAPSRWASEPVSLPRLRYSAPGQDPELFDYLDSVRIRRRVEEHFASLIASGERLDFLHLSDLHVPFHDIRVVYEAVDYAKACGISRAIIDGDFLDLYAVSDFPKYKHIHVNRERAVAEEILDFLCDSFEEVVMNHGNHERRIRRYFAARIDSDAQDLVEMDVLKSLAEKRPKVLYTGSWWVRIGSVIFAHPNGVSSVPARTVSNVSQHFMAKGITHTACVIGHTHRVVSGVVSRGVVLYECGCQAYDMDYLEDGDVRKEPWVKAFAHIALTQSGDIDAATSRVIPSVYDSLSVSAV